MYYGHLNSSKVAVVISDIKKVGKGYRVYYILNNSLESLPLSELISLVCNLQQGYSIKREALKFINTNVNKRVAFSIIATRIQNDIKAGICKIK